MNFPNSLEEIVTYIKTLDGDRLTGYMYYLTVQFKLQCKSNYEQDRFLITHPKHDTLGDFSPLRSQLNGVIIDAAAKSVIARSSPYLYRIKDVNNINFNDYRIYKARIGSVVSLYHYNGTWTLSTARTLDIGSCTIFDSSNFMCIFASLLRTVPDLEKETGMKYNIVQNKLTFDNLDKTQCYIFLISHPSLHFTAEQYICQMAGSTMPLVPYQEECEFSYDNRDYGHVFISKHGSNSYIWETKKMGFVRQYINGIKLNSKYNIHAVALKLFLFDINMKNIMMEIYPNIKQFEKTYKDFIYNLISMILIKLSDTARYETEKILYLDEYIKLIEKLTKYVQSYNDISDADEKNNKLTPSVIKFCIVQKCFYEDLLPAFIRHIFSQNKKRH